MKLFKKIIDMKLFKKISSWFIPKEIIRCVAGYDEGRAMWKVVYGYSIEECKEKIRRCLYSYECDKGFDVGILSDSVCGKYIFTIVDDTPGFYKTIEELENEID